MGNGCIRVLGWQTLPIRERRLGLGKSRSMLGGYCPLMPIQQNPLILRRIGGTWPTAEIAYSKSSVV